MSDRPAFEAITPAQCRAARGLLNWKQFVLADLCEVTQMTIVRFESGSPRQPHRSTLTKIRETFEAAGVTFLADRGVALKPPG